MLLPEREGMLFLFAVGAASIAGIVWLLKSDERRRARMSEEERKEDDETTAFLNIW